MTSLKILPILIFSLCLSFQLTANIDQPPLPNTQQIEKKTDVKLLFDRFREKFTKGIKEKRNEFIQSLFTSLQKDIITYFYILGYSWNEILDALDLKSREFTKEFVKILDIMKEHGIREEELLDAFPLA